MSEITNTGGISLQFNKGISKYPAVAVQKPGSPDVFQIYVRGYLICTLWGHNKEQADEIAQCIKDATSDGIQSIKIEPDWGTYLTGKNDYGTFNIYLNCGTKGTSSFKLYKGDFITPSSQGPIYNPTKQNIFEFILRLQKALKSDCKVYYNKSVVDAKKEAGIRAQAGTFTQATQALPTTANLVLSNFGYDTPRLSQIAEKLRSEFHHNPLIASNPQYLQYLDAEFDKYVKSEIGKSIKTEKDLELANNNFQPIVKKTISQILLGNVANQLFVDYMHKIGASSDFNFLSLQEKIQIRAIADKWKKELRQKLLSGEITTHKQVEEFYGSFKKDAESAIISSARDKINDLKQKAKHLFYGLFRNPKKLIEFIESHGINGRDFAKFITNNDLDSLERIFNHEIISLIENDRSLSGQDRTWQNVIKRFSGPDNEKRFTKLAIDYFREKIAEGKAQEQIKVSAPQQNSPVNPELTIDIGGIQNLGSHFILQIESRTDIDPTIKAEIISQYQKDKSELEANISSFMSEISTACSMVNDAYYNFKDGIPHPWPSYMASIDGLRADPNVRQLYVVGAVNKQGNFKTYIIVENKDRIIRAIPIDGPESDISKNNNSWEKFKAENTIVVKVAGAKEQKNWKVSYLPPKEILKLSCFDHLFMNAAKRADLARFESSATEFLSNDPVTQLAYGGFSKSAKADSILAITSQLINLGVKDQASFTPVSYFKDGQKLLYTLIGGKSSDGKYYLVDPKTYRIYVGSSKESALDSFYKYCGGQKADVIPLAYTPYGTGKTIYIPLFGVQENGHYTIYDPLSSEKPEDNMHFSGLTKEEALKNYFEHRGLPYGMIMYQQNGRIQRYQIPDQTKTTLGHGGYVDQVMGYWGMASMACLAAPDFTVTKAVTISGVVPGVWFALRAGQDIHEKAAYSRLSWNDPSVYMDVGTIGLSITGLGQLGYIARGGRSMYALTMFRGGSLASNTLLLGSTTAEALEMIQNINNSNISTKEKKRQIEQALLSSGINIALNVVFAKSDVAGLAAAGKQMHITLDLKQGLVSMQKSLSAAKTRGQQGLVTTMDQLSRQFQFELVTPEGVKIPIQTEKPQPLRKGGTPLSSGQVDERVRFSNVVENTQLLLSDVNPESELAKVLRSFESTIRDIDPEKLPPHLKEALYKQINEIHGNIEHLEPGKINLNSLKANINVLEVLNRFRNISKDNIAWVENLSSIERQQLMSILDSPGSVEYTSKNVNKILDIVRNNHVSVSAFSSIIQSPAFKIQSESFWKAISALDSYYFSKEGTIPGVRKEDFYKTVSNLMVTLKGYCVDKRIVSMDIEDILIGLRGDGKQKLQDRLDKIAGTICELRAIRSILASRSNYRDIIVGQKVKKGGFDRELDICFIKDGERGKNHTLYVVEVKSTFRDKYVTEQFLGFSKGDGGQLDVISNPHDWSFGSTKLQGYLKQAKAGDIDIQFVYFSDGKESPMTQFFNGPITAERLFQILSLKDPDRAAAFRGTPLNSMPIVFNKLP